MILKLYKTTDSNNTMGKNLTNEQVLDVTFKDVLDVINPIVLLKSSVPILSNYAYLPELERFYFITSIQIQPNNIYKLYLEVDVIESFKNDIKTSSGLVTRTSEGNPFFDGGLNSEVRKEITIHTSELEIPYAENIVLVNIK